MNKTTVVVSCPIDTYSGYGARSRDLVKALLRSGKYDVKVLAQRWGNTRFGYLDEHKEAELKSLIIPNLTSKPDVWIQITVPNEFQSVGTYNIGITAGIETTMCDSSWIQGCNRMNLILTSSTHSKSVFEKTVYNVEDQGKVSGELKLTTPIEVLFEGADINKYFPTSKVTSEFARSLDVIPESFCYLFVGHWLQGDIGQDRKNVGYLVKVFLETFKNKKTRPALILKTQSANASILDRDSILKKLDAIRETVKGDLPNIYLLHGEVTDEEINELYNHNKVKAMISLTRGEGFGRPLLEFSLVNKPIIASNWSGHLDFLHNEFTTLVGGALLDVDKSAVVKNIILKESQWFTPAEAQVVAALKNVYEKYKSFAELAKRQGYKSRTEYSFEKMADQLESILDTNLPEFPKQVTLNMPTLKLPKLEKING